LIILKDEFSYSLMLKLTIDIAAALALKYDVVISRSFTTRRDYENTKTPFLMNIRREGVSA
jgi:hypothetical protein